MEIFLGFATVMIQIVLVDGVAVHVVVAGHEKKPVGLRLQARGFQNAPAHDFGDRVVRLLAAVGQIAGDDDEIEGLAFGRERFHLLRQAPGDHVLVEFVDGSPFPFR